ncbi:MAG: GNAT family N-acetyltransferase [Clostridia bacterium]|nr:GNAT family N-acetyltransferase [Clostridia bacterium]
MKQKAIKTPRLILGEIEDKDKDDLISMMTDPGVYGTYMVPDLDTEEKKAALFERLRDISRSDRFFYGIFLQNKLIGILHEAGGTDDEPEIGYVISPAEKGKGYATEAFSAAVSALFDGGAKAVVAGAFEENPASLRVMEKCGLSKTKETEDIEYRGKIHKCIYMKIKRLP